ncbi:hypothetical protein KSP40_PGU001512 [Platanthera guangdongensis]|uniref:Uncharacterized protein n=1 Tax=Platanthera guangdongensis TaxID=2320717 RepID=A0ABR2M561_9ASPA
MIGTGKLQRKPSKSGKARSSETEKMAGARNPLGDLNIISIPPIQASVEAQRRSCFRFIRPNSSSSKQIFVPRSKSQHRTPKSAPPNLKKPTNPKAPDLLHKWNELRPSSKGITRGKTSRQQPIFKPADSEVKEDKQLSTTPCSNSTPPIQASISPEIPCSLSAAPTPVCFAAGHVMAGVQDRRKCRPRGILTTGQKQSNVSRISSASPPCNEASVCWFSSPLKIGNGNGSAKSNSSILEAKFEGQTTPSSCTGILKTPTSGSSISPFSAIVQRAEASSGLQVLPSPNENQGYPYGDGSEISPCSVKSWSNNDVVSTSSSYTKSRSNGVISPLGVSSSTLDLEARRLPTRTVLEKHQTDVSPLNSSSFRFGCKPTFLNSIDLNCFKNSRFNELLKAEKKKDNSSASDVGISWREGLLSRIFETGDLDSYQSFFVDDESYDYPRDGDESSFKNRSSIFEKGNGFGSYEFSAESNKIGDQMCQSKVPPLCSNSVAESISTDGVLISSGDSDWTLFYKNNLFEV